jgi:hypothetical protein
MTGIHEKRTDLIQAGLPEAHERDAIRMRHFMNGATLVTYHGRPVLEFDAPQIEFESGRRGGRVVIRQGYRYIENMSTRM